MPNNRITVTAPSGTEYEILKACPLTMADAGLSALVKVAKAESDNAEEVSEEQAGGAIELIRKVLVRFVMHPAVFEGHPRDLRKELRESGDWTTFEDMGDDATFLYEAITSGKEAQKTAAAVGSFPENG